MSMMNRISFDFKGWRSASVGKLERLEQFLLGRARHGLDFRLAFQGATAAVRWLMINHFHRQSTARKPRRRASLMLLQAAWQVVGYAGVQRIVTAPQDVD